MRVPNARFLADADAEAGFGHLARSTALACALAHHGWDVHARALRRGRSLTVDGIEWGTSVDEIASATRPDVVVVDSYEPGAWDLAAGIDADLRIGFDDGAALSDRVHALIAVAREPGPADATGTDLAGPSFACLRRAYWEPRDRPIAPTVTQVLITTGWGSGSDPPAAALALAAATALPDAEITVIGEQDPNYEASSKVSFLARRDSLLEPLYDADIVVCAGGQTMLEAAATGAPIVAITTADNQAMQVEMMLRGGAAIGVAPENVGEALDTLAGPNERRRLSERARRTVDGHGALRTASAIEAMLRGAPIRSDRRY